MNKAKIAWITDTTSSLSKEFVEQHHIHVVPLHVVINKESFKETIDISVEEFYNRMEQEVDSTFQSAQSSLGDFVDLYTKLKEEYEFGIAFHASSDLTGTYNASMLAADMVGFKLFAIDTRTGSYPHAYLINKGIKLINQGIDVNEMIAQVEAIRDNTRFFLVPSSLDQLHKSGRVSGSQKFLASLFQIKPILSIEDGKAKIREKVRTERKALAWIIDQLKEEYVQHSIDTVAIVHTNNLEKAKKIEQEIKNLFPAVMTEILLLIPVAGVHTGVGTVGMGWVYE